MTKQPKNHKTHISPACLLVLFTTSFLSGQNPLAKAAIVEKEFYLNVDRAYQNQTFPLILTSYNHHCATTYTHLSVAVNHTDSIITLTYLPTTPPDTSCPENQMRYGPTFTVTGLQRSRYTVQVVVLLTCEFQDPPCEVDRGAPRYAGYITVQKSEPWLIKPDTVSADAAFSLQILHDNYESCGYEFVSKQVAVVSDTIRLIYSTRFHAILCDNSESPWGPTFELPALNAGTYQIVAADYPSCLSAPDPCEVAEPMPQWVGNITVHNNQLLTPTSHKKAVGSISKLSLTSDKLAVTITGTGLSTVRASLFKISGAFVHAEALASSDNRTALFTFPKSLGRGIYVCRVLIPGGIVKHQKLSITR